MFSFSATAAAEPSIPVGTPKPITITVQNLAGKTESFDVYTNTKIDELKQMVKNKELVNGNTDLDLMMLFKEVEQNNVLVARKLDEIGVALSYYYIGNGDKLHVIVNEAEPYDPSLKRNNNKMGGKRYRRKSHRRHKTRGKKSRKH
jgi:hypothetical protein